MNVVDGPRDDLYIYYLKGRVAPNLDLREAGFIGNWEEDGFSFLFYTRPCVERIDAILSAQPQLTLIDAYHMTYAEWLGERPTTFSTGRFIIVPPWEKCPEEIGPNGELLPLVLDPGVVFGTGTHVTTRDCLRALETVYATDAPPPLTTVDLGTGTGVLALAAAAMGSRKTLAVDINFLAARTAAENVRLNRMEDRILAVQGKAEIFIDRPADLLVANIHFDVMRLVLTTAGFRQKKWFVLSGLMRSQADTVAKLLAESEADVLYRREGKGVWHTFMGTNPGAFR
jgi:ribosomal protein L11 methyltransferase